MKHCVGEVFRMFWREVCVGGGGGGGGAWEEG